MAQGKYAITYNNWHCKIIGNTYIHIYIYITKSLCCETNTISHLYLKNKNKIKLKNNLQWINSDDSDKIVDILLLD